MKKQRLFAKIVSIVTLVAVVATCAALFAACNKKPTRSITDIFKMRSSYGEFTDNKLEFLLPPEWEVYTNSTTSSTSSNTAQYSDVGYIPEMDAFVVCLKQGGKTKLSVVKCGDETLYHPDLIKGMLFHPNQGIRALRYKDGIIACLFDDGTAGAFDASNGREVLSRTKIGADVNDPSKTAGYNDTNNGNIDSIIKILCPGLIAVHYNYDHKGTSGYTSIFRTESSGNINERGVLVCRIKNESNNLAQVNGFDGKYASVSGSSNGEYMFKIPASAPSGGAEDLDPTTAGSFTTNNNTNYSDECTYIGGGKFFVSQDWEVSEGNDYTYYNGSKYVKCNRGVYDAEKDKFSQYDENKVLNNITNNYYTSSKAGIDTRDYLNDGYSYVSYGLTIYETGGKKLGLYDQFIIDRDLNIVMSLTGNYGVEISGQTKDKVGFFDLIMYGVDGLYYVPYQPSEVNLYDKNGKLVGHNDRSAITRQEFNCDIMVAEMPGESSSTSLYGAYNRYGELIVPFEYDMLASYRGPYTIGRRYGKKDADESASQRYLRLIGPNGKEVDEMEIIENGVVTKTTEHFKDIAYSSSSSVSATNAIYKTGCYMFKVDSGEKTSGGATVYNYGIRNFEPSYLDSVIMEPTMAAGSILYAPSSSPSDVFVFQKLTDSAGKVSYAVYRLI